MSSRNPFLCLIFASACSSSFAAETTLFGKGATWKYLDNGIDQGTAWRASAFADGTWASGAAPLGFSTNTPGTYGSISFGTTVSFGSNPGARHPTTYFRKSFNVTNVASVTSLSLNILRDDGLVVYINGVEAGRRGMPAGPITFSTFATDTVLINSSYESLVLSKASLVEGANVIAVELHQINSTSSDLMIDAELISSDLAPSRIASGPWVGGVTPDSATVTARLDSAGLSARLVASTSPTLSNPIYSNSATSAALTGETLRLSLTGLLPNTVYHYALEVGGVVDTTAVRRGSFQTFPSGASNVRIGFGACAQTDVARLSFDALLAASPRLFINMGDFHYRDTNSTNPANYRANYAEVFNNTSQAALYRNVPTAYTWDDHDYCGNDSDRNSVGRSTVRQVYREWVPHYPLVPGQGTINQTFRLGRIRLIMTDLRSEADPQAQVDNAAKTKMGIVQKAWFKQQLLAARDEEAPLILWVCSAPWIGIPSLGTDTWQNNTTERREIADFIKANSIKNVTLLSGDMHALAFDDGTNSDYATGGGAPLKVFHAAALGRNSSSIKGGPYSSGAPVQNPDNGILGQYGILDITDAGGSSPIGVTFTGWRVPELTPRLTYTFNTVAVQPRIPLLPTATAGADGITVTWQDDSTVETGFRIEQSADGSSGWTSLTTTAAGATNYVDTTAPPGQIRYYRVITLSGILESAPSAIVSATAATAYMNWAFLKLADARANPEADLDGDSLSNLL